jgi:1,4-alpha-glucan branching enzyme
MKRMSMAVVSAVTLFLISAYGISARAEGEVTTVFKYSDPNAGKVEVAGEFSNWKMLPMTNDGAGNWTATLHLKPGYYGYKFVVNGEWVLDPANPAKKVVNDIENSALSVGGVQAPAGATAPGGAGKVSVTFTFADTNARTVHVAGEFNNWLDNDQGRVSGHAEWMLQNDGAGNWKLTAPLAPGRYKFKYVVDGGDRWEKDRTLPSTADDNSLIEAKAGGGGGAVAGGAGKTRVTFSFFDAGAKTVHLAGQFNNWLDNDQGRVSGHAEWMLQNDGAGNWSITVPLAAGKYPFKYVVDGGDRWELDPKMPTSSDGNSEVEVTAGGGGGGTTGGAGATGGAVFTYSGADATAVAVVGDFNQWNTTANPMAKDAAGSWTVMIPLKSGKYQYKFLVDGNWIEDPANPEKADDGFGGKNSIKIVP